MSVFELLRSPWPWYVSGPLIGLIVPLLLILGNKSFGISSSLRHICAAAMPAGIPFFRYNWKRETWNLLFVAGIIGGALICTLFLKNPNPVQLNPALITELRRTGINNFVSLVPVELFNWRNLLTLQGFVLIVVGGFLIGLDWPYLLRWFLYGSLRSLT